MPFTAQEAIDQAREKHRALTDAQSPTRAALNALNRYVRRLRWELSRINPDRYASTQTISFPLATFDNGAALTDPDAVILGGTITYSNTDQENELTIVPWANRLQPGQGPAAYIVDGTMFFVGEEEDWSEVASVILRYHTVPTDAAQESSSVDLPDEALEPCVDYVAKWMANRGPLDTKITPRDQQRLTDEHALSERTFLDQIGKQHRRKTFVVREVW